jgi:hypothetical protein
MHRQVQRIRHSFVAASLIAFTALLILAGCDDQGDAVDEPASTTPAPTATEVASTAPEHSTATAPSTPSPTGTIETPVPIIPDLENIDLAPELTGLRDWRGIDKTTLAGLRGKPVILVFWNSI